MKTTPIQLLAAMAFFLCTSLTAQNSFLGIYPTDNTEGEGVLITGIVAGSGAEAAGLKAGDVLLAIDGQKLVSTLSLHEALASHQPQNQVMVSCLREGRTRTTQITLGDRQHFAPMHKKRNPCDVFIGVLIGGKGAEGKGVQITGIVAGTPAETAQLQPGDLILALDDVETNSYEALVTERNKHKPGEWFTLSVSRQGQVLDVDAQFPTCPQQPHNQTPQQPTIQEEPDPTDPVLVVDNKMDLIDFSTFPNPTYGELNIRFQAEAKPTTVRITDVNGRVVFEEDRPDFDGYYSRPIDLQNVQPCLLLLTIQQENRLYSEKILLMPRA
ncbi:MAG: PDZ domain-containing protein [Saprospiraceae bacterium]